MVLPVIGSARRTQPAGNGSPTTSQQHAQYDCKKMLSASSIQSGGEDLTPVCYPNSYPWPPWLRRPLFGMSECTQLANEMSESAVLTLLALQTSRNLGRETMPQKPLDVFDKIELFFKDPHSPNDVPGDFSSLYLLRKDAWKCYGCDPSNGTETTPVLFPGAMTVFCGVDLLAKFYESDSGSVGDRFKNYVRDFFPSGRLSADVPTHVYGLRNSLMHSFGMRDRKKKAAGDVCYGIKVDYCHKDDLVVELKSGEWFVVDLLLLHEEFEASIEEFKKHLHRNAILHQQFSEMWDRYGSIYFNGVLLSTDENDTNHQTFALYQGYSMLWEL